MARITVTDCLENVENRFQLVLLATKRARQLMQGAEPLVEPDNDKPTVIALREIAEGLVTEHTLNEQFRLPEMAVSDDEEWDDDELIDQFKLSLNGQTLETDTQQSS